MKKFKVVELDHEIDYSKKKPITVWKSKKTILFTDKFDAWKHFNASIFPYWGNRDFLEDIDWNDELLVTAHMDEGGCNNCILYKWEGFDDDIEIGWEYNGVLYRNLRELWKAYPQYFNGIGLWEDSLYIQGNEGQKAELKIRYKNPEFNKKKTEYKIQSGPENTVQYPDLPF